MDEAFFTAEEKAAFRAHYRTLIAAMGDAFDRDDLRKIKRIFRQTIPPDCYRRDGNGLNGGLRCIETALIVVKEIGLRREPLLAFLLYRPVRKEYLSAEEVERLFGEETAHLLRLLIKTTSLYTRNTAVNTENFHHLLFSFAEDVRVLLLMIADRLCLMRRGKQLVESDRLRLSSEAASLYAPLAHRLGLYVVKSELEDLVLKYTDPQQFDFIRHKLNETKRSRDAYIAQFINPVSERLLRAGLHFDIKGRTKSIHSINNKLKKQKVDFEDIYDLFAIRIILDTPLERERAECWYVYSLLTDMYPPNPSRMRDWISIPKANGYESLHITVMGPQKRWVEVQIRTQRMDEVAERGLAAHWKYKGVTLPDFNIERYKEEIYVFTPGGELIKLPQGATIPDFAFAIHTGLGSRCVSALVNGRNVPLKHVLHSGDTVTILTAHSQTPKQDWLNFVITPRARLKIKQALREEAAKNVETAKETLQRRFKNRKIDVDEAVFMRYTKRKGYKTLTDFYTDIATNRLDPNTVIEEYLELLQRENEVVAASETRSADEFVPPPLVPLADEDILFEGQNVKGMEYKLASCCNPMRGDAIFGFISTQGIRIHRSDCPNASDMTHRFPHRVIAARWSSLPDNADCVAILRITGRDDLTIVTSLTSVVTKESGITLRNLTIDTAAGLFQATMTIASASAPHLTRLIKKLRPLKGITAIQRLS
ncbi:MAG: TGS domain-containing protein [Tannerellaceae bacterium]|jgi:GTP pyrophosphokinase|nr:TGS domain-containing protein [Tannerellaceae bacterium]